MLDTSVAVKFYVPEEGHEQARELLAIVEDSGAKLLAPSPSSGTRSGKSTVRENSKKW